MNESRFGHHPDPATDFCVEVEVLEGMAYEVKVGLANEEIYRRRKERALLFKVGGDPFAVRAKAELRNLP